ncbi:hypothetical protein AAAC51_14600 [Priestia megaterium]
MNNMHDVIDATKTWEGSSNVLDSFDDKHFHSSEAQIKKIWGLRLIILTPYLNIK